MCKHVAAVLYGIGARLDERPELLFLLRSVDQQDLIAKVAMDAGLSKASAGAAVESFLEGVAKELKKGGSVTLVGFGSFKTSVRKARMGRNPQTGEPIKIPAKRVCTFRLAKSLKDSVLGKK